VKIGFVPWPIKLTDYQKELDHCKTQQDDLLLKLASLQTEAYHWA